MRRIIITVACGLIVSTGAAAAYLRLEQAAEARARSELVLLKQAFARQDLEFEASVASASPLTRSAVLEAVRLTPGTGGLQLEIDELRLGDEGEGRLSLDAIGVTLAAPEQPQRMTIERLRARNVAQEDLRRFAPRLLASSTLDGGSFRNRDWVSGTTTGPLEAEGITLEGPGVHARASLLNAAEIVEGIAFDVRLIDAAFTIEDQREGEGTFDALRFGALPLRADYQDALRLDPGAFVRVSLEGLRIEDSGVAFTLERAGTSNIQTHEGFLTSLEFGLERAVLEPLADGASPERAAARQRFAEIGLERIAVSTKLDFALDLDASTFSNHGRLELHDFGALTVDTRLDGIDVARITQQLGEAGDVQAAVLETIERTGALARLAIVYEDAGLMQGTDPAPRARAVLLAVMERLEEASRVLLSPPDQAALSRAVAAFAEGGQRFAVVFEPQPPVSSAELLARLAAGTPLTSRGDIVIEGH